MAVVAVVRPAVVAVAAVVAPLGCGRRRRLGAVRIVAHPMLDRYLVAHVETAQALIDARAQLLESECVYGETALVRLLRTLNVRVGLPRPVYVAGARKGKKRRRRRRHRWLARRTFRVSRNCTPHPHGGRGGRRGGGRGGVVSSGVRRPVALGHNCVLEVGEKGLRAPQAQAA